MKRVEIKDSDFLQEGKWYDFTYLKTTILPDESKYHIVIDPFNNKHFLDAQQYLNYNIENQKSIHCLIDKMNCAGKIFIEPENPFYKVNNMYDFDVKSYDYQINSFSEQELIVTVSDVFGTEYFVSSFLKTNELKEKIAGKVLKIRKGKLILNCSGFHNAIKLQANDYHEFTIKNISSLCNGTEYYILLDHFGDTHLLRKKYYSNFNYQKNQTILCKPIVFSDKEYFLEPKNPFYEIGKVYDFEIIGREKLTMNGLENKNILIVSDKFQNKIKVILQEPVVNENLKTISCQVDDFRIGKLVLKII